LTRASRAPFNAIRAGAQQKEMGAVTAVFPASLGRSSSLTFEIQLAHRVSAILAFDGILARSEESFAVFRTKYSHLLFSF